jgi:hypothetical protein
VGVRNYLVEGVSGTGRTTVCTEVNRRGHHAVHGDRELAYQGDRETGERPGEFGAAEAERELFVRLHRKREDIPATGIRIDATRAVTDVVDEILRHAGLATA